MAVPGNVLSGRNRGGHALIRDGAKIVECVDDIVEELGLLPTGSKAASHGSSDSGLKASADSWVAAMEPGEAYDLDRLAGMSGINGVQLLPRLFDLELHGLVRRVAGGRFMRPI